MDEKTKKTQAMRKIANPIEITLLHVNLDKPMKPLVLCFYIMFFKDFILKGINL